LRIDLEFVLAVEGPAARTRLQIAAFIRRCRIAFFVAAHLFKLQPADELVSVVEGARPLAGQVAAVIDKILGFKTVAQQRIAGVRIHLRSPRLVHAVVVIGLSDTKTQLQPVIR